MTLHHTLMTRLRHFCHSEPDMHAWKGICSLLTRLEKEGERALVLEYAQSNLEHWPDALRIAPPYWAKRVIRGDVPAFWPIVRRLNTPSLNIDALKLFANNPHMNFLSSLSVCKLQAMDAPDLFKALGQGTLHETLEELTLGCQGTSDGALTLLCSKPWTALKRLELRGCRYVNGDFLKAHAKDLPNLRELMLLDIVPASLGALIENLLKYAPTTLQVLDMRSLVLTGEMVLSLVHSNRFQLQRLRCFQAHIAGEAQAHCIRLGATDSAKLRSKDADTLRKQLAILKNTPIQKLFIHGTDDSDGCVDVLSKHRMAHLERLELHYLALSSKGAATLARAQWLPQLRALTLARNKQIGLEGILGLLRQLGQSDRLEELDLSGCGLDLEPIFRAVQTYLPKLQKLHVFQNRLSGPSVLAFLEQTAIPSLGLDIHQIEPEWRTHVLSYHGVARHFLQNDTPEGDDELFMPQRFPLDDHEYACALRTLYCDRVTRIDMSQTRIGPKTIEAIAQAPNWRLNTLNFGHCPNMNASWLRMFGQSKAIGSLSRLVLNSCDLDDDALAALAQLPFRKKSTSNQRFMLSMVNNNFTETGYEALCNAAWIGKGVTVLAWRIPNTIVKRFKALNVSTTR